MNTFKVDQLIYSKSVAGELKVNSIVNKKNQLTLIDQKENIKYLICITADNKTVQINIDEIILPEELT